MRMIRAGSLALLLGGLGWSALAQTPDKPLRIAAASSMQPALAELLPLFEQQQRQAGGSSARLQLTLGSSANLMRQLQQGLPAELFLSADEEFANRLVDAGLTEGGGAVYATGRIVLLVPANATLALDPTPGGLPALLAGVPKFAIANPALAPYGLAAQQALQNLKWWSSLQDRLVLGENVAQATQFVSTGAAQAGITALSMVKTPALAKQVRYVLLPEQLHAPIRQRMVLLKNPSPAAKAFYDFMLSSPAKLVLTKYGFS